MTINDAFASTLDDLPTTSRETSNPDLFSRIAASFRLYIARRETAALLRTLPDATLIDIGIDPRSVGGCFQSTDRTTFAMIMRVGAR